jgi:hypothetical protein
VNQQQARTSFSEEKPGRPARSKKPLLNLVMGVGILKAHGPDSKEFLRRFLQKAASFCSNLLRHRRL